MGTGNWEGHILFLMAKKAWLKTNISSCREKKKKSRGFGALKMYMCVFGYLDAAALQPYGRNAARTFNAKNSTMFINIVLFFALKVRAALRPYGCNAAASKYPNTHIYILSAPKPRDFFFFSLHDEIFVFSHAFFAIRNKMCPSQFPVPIYPSRKPALLLNSYSTLFAVKFIML